MTKERWAQIGITTQFLIVVRTLGEIFRLRYVHGTNFSGRNRYALCGRCFNSWLLLLDRCDLVLLPTLRSVRLDRASVRSHSDGVQNCRDRLVMGLTSTIEPKAERITSVTEWIGDFTQITV